MSIKMLSVWFSIVSCITVILGLIFSFMGFSIFPESILPGNVLLVWESAIYGAVLIGWGTTLFFLGQLAFHRKDIMLMKIMLLGITVWLIIEAIFSVLLGVYFNVGVDFVVLALLGVPLVISIKKIKVN